MRLCDKIIVAKPLFFQKELVNFIVTDKLYLALHSPVKTFCDTDKPL